MGFLDRFRKPAADAVDKHGDQIGDAADKAGDMADEHTGGKYSEKIDSGVDKGKGALDNLDGQNDDIADKPEPTQPTA
jgi:hypothetical protein